MADLYNQDRNIPVYTEKKTVKMIYYVCIFKGRVHPLKMGKRVQGHFLLPVRPWSLLMESSKGMSFLIIFNIAQNIIVLVKLIQSY